MGGSVPQEACIWLAAQDPPGIGGACTIGKEESQSQSNEEASEGKEASDSGKDRGDSEA